MKLNVFNRKGEETGRTVELSDAVFGIEPNNRQGTHKSKERSEVSGSTRKLIRQKGSGGARRGDINSPVLVGGGRVFGPKPRDYSFKLNKKVKALARRSALSYKAKENSIMVLEDFTMDTPKTKDFLSMLKVLKLDGKKMLLILPESNHFVSLSARNLPRAKVIAASDLNTYKVMDAANLVFTEQSVAVIEKLLNA